MHRPRLTAFAIAALLASSACAQSLNIDIPAEPLDKALNALARQAKVQIIFASDLASDKTAPAIKGQFTVDQAFSRLLQRTGLRVHEQGDRTFTIEKAAAATPGKLPTVLVTGSPGDQAGLQTDGYAATRVAAVTKSELSLAETPQSITVVARAVMDAQQAQSLTDVLRNVPGVIAGSYGRRNWDDLIIRGHVASDSIYLDGLRIAASSRVAEQVSGLQQVEVLKGPGSLLYGMVLPGGLVNLVSKRPQAETLANADVTVGSDDFRQATLDLNTPLSENGKSAFRLNALSMNADDATHYVWSRSRYIAPSLSLDLGPRTDFTLLTSYQQRQYIRQQGLPTTGTVLPNRNGSIDRNLFTGEPGERPYNADQTRLGYSLTHRFDDGWTLHNNLRWQTFAIGGQLVTNGALSTTNLATLARTATDQRYDGETFTVDTNMQKNLATAFGKHDLAFGIDYLQTRENVLSYTCTVASINVYNPVYGARVNCPATPRTSTETSVRSVGIYLRDQVKFGERLMLLTGLRHDDASTYSTNKLTSAHSDNPARATTGSAALMFEAAPGVRPYISYATSFIPNSGTDVSGGAFKPEKGRQVEAGVKFDLNEGRSSLTVAAFELHRKNVLESDPLNSGFSVAVGEERSRGVELGFASDFKNGLSVMGGYAYTAAMVTDDGGQAATSVGQWLNNVPRHSFNATARYRFSGQLSGWELNGGARGESQRRAYAYKLAGYVVADAGVAYTTGRWRAALNVKNLFNTDYYAGGALASVVAVGDPRTVMLTVGYHY